MADFAPIKDRAAAYGLSLTTAEIVGTAAGTINGNWVTPCKEVVWTAMLIRYEENDGITMVDADIQVQVMFAGDSTVYTVRDQGNSVFEINALTGVDIAFSHPLAGVGAGDIVLDLRGVTHIRAVANTTGTTHAAGDRVDVSFIGYEAVWMP